MTMQRSLPILVFSCAVLFSMAGCYGPDREPGDDPRSATEGPDGGRPKTDPAQTVDESGWGGGSTSDMGEKAEDGNSTLDGTSDEVTDQQ